MNFKNWEEYLSPYLNSPAKLSEAVVSFHLHWRSHILYDPYTIASILERQGYKKDKVREALLAIAEVETKKLHWRKKKRILDKAEKDIDKMLSLIYEDFF